MRMNCSVEIFESTAFEARHSFGLKPQCGGSMLMRFCSHCAFRIGQFVRLWTRMHLLAGGLVFAVGAANAQSGATLAWDPSESGDVTGYRIYYGNASGDYTQSVDAGNATKFTISNLSAKAVYYFAVTAYNAAGLESDFSNEVMYAPGRPVLSLAMATTRQVTVSGRGFAGRTYQVFASEDLANWTPLGTAKASEADGVFMFTDAAVPSFQGRFYRAQDMEQ